MILVITFWMIISYINKIIIQYWMILVITFWMNLSYINNHLIFM